MANITLLDLARQGKLGSFKDPQAAIDNYYKTNPLMVGVPEEVVVQSILYPNAPTKAVTPTAAPVSGPNYSLYSPDVMADRRSRPAAPKAEAAPKEMTKADLQAQQASWTRTLPEHLKPKIEKDKDGNEIVTIQGSLLNKIMRDMYSAGEENYQLQNMPINPEMSNTEQRSAYAAGMTAPETRTPENDQRVAAGQVPVQQQMVQQPVQTPYDSRVSIPNPSTADPYASTIIRELQNAYPGRTTEELLSLLAGRPFSQPGAVPTTTHRASNGNVHGGGGRGF